MGGAKLETYSAMLLILALMLAGCCALMLPAALRLWAVLRLAAAALMAGFAVLGALALLAPEAEPLALPLGPPWAAALVGLDAVSAWFLAPLGALGCFSALLLRPATRTELLAFPPLLLGLVLAAVAADGFTLVLGLLLAAVAAWAALPERRAARLMLGFALTGGLCLMAGFALMSAGAGSLGFAALRASPPEGWMAAAVLVLALLGAAALGGLSPLHGWVAGALSAAPAQVAPLLAGALPVLALLAALRLVLELSGPAQPSWWGLAPLLLGGFAVLIGGFRALVEDGLRGVLGGAVTAGLGLFALGLGLALLFRGSDMDVPAALALAGALLAGAHLLLGVGLLALALSVVQMQAGPVAGARLDALGGLAHNMPLAAGAALVAALSIAALPPFAGFAALWLLTQALLAAWRTQQALYQFAALGTLIMLGLGMGLLAMAMVRLWGMVFLGRPRSPRVAGAEDAPGPARAALLFPALALLGLGALPPLAMALMQGAVEQLLGGAAPASILGLAAGDAGARYLVLPVLAVMAGLMALLWWVARRRAPKGLAEAPLWQGGFIAPPPHMPFGDPSTQVSAEGFAAPVLAVLGGPLGGYEARVLAAPPGSVAAARFESRWRDPFARALVRLTSLRHQASLWAERGRLPAPRAALRVGFLALLALLALLVLAERP